MTAARHGLLLVCAVVCGLGPKGASAEPPGPAVKWEYAELSYHRVAYSDGNLSSSATWRAGKSRLRETSDKDYEEALAKLSKRLGAADVKNVDVISLLDQVGQDGWELVSHRQAEVVGVTDTWLFKRPVRAPANQKGDAAPKDPGKEPGKDEPAQEVLRRKVHSYVIKSVGWIVTTDGKDTSLGTGTLIDRESRLLLTSYEVVHGQTSLVVFFPVHDKEGKLVLEREANLDKARRAGAVKGKVLGHDKTHDLAMIQLERVPDGVESLPIATLEPELGDAVHMIGNPKTSKLLWLGSRGLVRNVYRKDWRAVGEGAVFDVSARVIEILIPNGPHPGSGAPGVNGRGEMVGLASGSKNEGKDSVLAYLIGHSEVEDFIGKLFKAAPELKGKRWSPSTASALGLLTLEE